VRGNETLLLVEDEGELRRITRQLLEQGGYRVIEAENALRALQIVQEYAGTIHMVVTDVVMPGMSGPELTQRMKELCPEARVLYISGYADRAFQHHGVQEGVPILEKPYSGSDLLMKVQEVLGRG
jgi:CheY-like chemotaxis protein